MFGPGASPTPSFRERTRSTATATQATAPNGSRLPHKRSQSIDPVGLGIDSNKFVDPLVVRRKESAGIVSPKPTNKGGKLAVGQLVAFFDGDK